MILYSYKCILVSSREAQEDKEMTQKDLRIGSVLEDLNGEKHTVIRFDGIFTVTTYGNGENWLVDSHLEHEKLVKY